MALYDWLNTLLRTTYRHILVGGKFAVCARDCWRGGKANPEKTEVVLLIRELKVLNLPSSAKRKRNWALERRQVLSDYYVP